MGALVHMLISFLPGLVTLGLLVCATVLVDLVLHVYQGPQCQVCNTASVAVLPYTQVLKVVWDGCS